MSSQPTRPGVEPELDERTKAVLAERLKTLERDRKNAVPAAEAFRRVLEKPKP